MSSADLFAKIQLFALNAKIEILAKHAGTLGYPEYALQEASDFIIQCYCAKKADLLATHIEWYRDRFMPDENDEEMKENVIIYGTCKRISAGLNKKEVKSGKAIFVEVPDDEPEVDSSLYGYFHIRMVDHKKATAKEIGDWQGLWSGFSLNELKNQKAKGNHGIGEVLVQADPEVDFIDSLQELEYRLAQIRDTVRHEIQHFIQSFIAFFTKGLNEWGGLPGKRIRDPRFDPYGKPLSDDPKARSKMRNMLDPTSQNDRTHHSLADIEFYPALSDAISRFNHEKMLLPIALHRDYMLVFVGHISPAEFLVRAEPVLRKEILRNRAPDPLGTEYSQALYDAYAEPAIKDGLKWVKRYFSKPFEFFHLLKKHQPAKYGKAVAEFSKAVGL